MNFLAFLLDGMPPNWMFTRFYALCFGGSVAIIWASRLLIQRKKGGEFWSLMLAIAGAGAVLWSAEPLFSWGYPFVDTRSIGYVSALAIGLPFVALVVLSAKSKKLRPEIANWAKGAVIFLAVGVAAFACGRALRRTAVYWEAAAIRSIRFDVRQLWPWAIEQFHHDVGRYPTTDEGLNVLMQAPLSEKDRWRGPYPLGSNGLVDWWDSPVRYRFPARKSSAPFDVWSLGPDKIESADDIGNWEKK